MDLRYVKETFWSNLHNLKLNTGRVTINNIIDQIQRDFGINVSRREILEVLFADEIKQSSIEMQHEIAPPRARLPGNEEYFANARLDEAPQPPSGCREIQSLGIILQSLFVF